MSLFEFKGVFESSGEFEREKGRFGWFGELRRVWGVLESFGEFEEFKGS